MRPASRATAWIVALSLAGCGGDYWIGGARGQATGAGGAGSPGADGGHFDHVLDGDIVLRDADTLDWSSRGTGTCRVLGNGHAIVSDGQWTGHVAIDGCTLDGLGTAAAPAMDLVTWGSGSLNVQNSTFVRSGGVRVTNQDDSTTTFSHNTIGADSLVALDPSVDASTPAFYAIGSSEAPKYFQGNTVLRSNAWFQSNGWQIGGLSAGEGNVIAGVRGGIVLSGTGMRVQGNYVHVLHYDGAGDEAALSTLYDTTDALAEHNVLRGGSWVVRGFGGEFRYDAVLDVRSSAWLNQPFENTRIHHSVFFLCETPEVEIEAGVNLVNQRAVGIEIYENTFDGGGPAMAFSGPPVAIESGSFVSSLRSDLFVGFPLRRNDGGTAAIRPGVLEGTSPRPVRLGYADYNAFFDPDAVPPHNYGVAVAGKTERVDDGFGAHDAHAGGPVDEQVDPGPLGVPGCFPWDDADIIGRRVTVFQILSAIRAAYVPVNALVNAGDPADGPGSSIGAVGGGGTNDRFGTLSD
ncbi:MAG TPA: hypothetical protein VHE30_22245 [Polyangiaceae bacterium]|nr:hypothetical protein [Polyangiaceae bacterium]